MFSLDYKESNVVMFVLLKSWDVSRKEFPLEKYDSVFLSYLEKKWCQTEQENVHEVKLLVCGFVFPLIMNDFIFTLGYNSDELCCFT